VAETDCPRAAHEAEQQGHTEPQTQLEIIGGIAQPNYHDGCGEDLNCDRCRYKADDGIDLRLSDGLPDAVARRV
jgi:hypothetical protein